MVVSRSSCGITACTVQVVIVAVVVVVLLRVVEAVAVLFIHVKDEERYHQSVFLNSVTSVKEKFHRFSVTFWR